MLLSNGKKIGEQGNTFKRDYFVGDKNSRSLTYLVMGDSTAAGWGAAQLSDTYPYRVAEAVAERGYRVHIVNVAVGGATLGDVYEKQIEAINEIEPDLITLSFGGNDATHFTSEADYLKELQSLVAALKASGAKKVLVANTPDMYQAPALALPLAIATNFRARRLNGVLDGTLRGSNIQIVDLYDKGKLIYDQDKDLYAADLFHPSSQGYDVWSKLFIERLGGL